jgi:hypothetical protein
MPFEGCRPTNRRLGYAVTQRIRALLDEAVADLEPRSHDPVAAVVGRGRAARRRTMLAATLAIALLAGGLAAGGWAVVSRGTGGDSSTAADSPVDRPPTPHVVDRVVIAGALRLPVPAGWQVDTASAAEPCTTLTKTILIFVSNNRGCQYAPVEVYGTVNINPGGEVAWMPKGGTLDGLILSSPVSVTLRGGEPGWLSYDLGADALKPPKPGYYNTLILPWSQVMLQLRGDGAEERKIIESIRTVPSGSGRLAVPDTAALVELTMPDAKGRNLPAGHAKTSAPAAIASVIRLLREQKTVVDDDKACASAAQYGARLTFSSAFAAAAEGATWPRSATASRPPDPVPEDTTTVIITVGGRCQEAVSSDGGRVRLSDATLAQLKHLFGIGIK